MGERDDLPVPPLGIRPRGVSKNNATRSESIPWSMVSKTPKRNWKISQSIQKCIQIDKASVVDLCVY